LFVRPADSLPGIGHELSGLDHSEVPDADETEDVAQVTGGEVDLATDGGTARGGDQVILGWSPTVQRPVLGEKPECRGWVVFCR
jgi:hypothetical protein